MSYIKEKYLNNIPIEDDFDDYCFYTHSLEIVKNLDKEINKIIKGCWRSKAAENASDREGGITVEKAT